jgi:hypothetical protein
MYTIRPQPSTSPGAVARARELRDHPPAWQRTTQTGVTAKRTAIRVDDGGQRRTLLLDDGPSIQHWWTPADGGEQIGSNPVCATIAS